MEDGRRRKEALADALAGVAASLVSLWCFYPIDLHKTKVQASSKWPPKDRPWYHVLRDGTTRSYSTYSSASSNSSPLRDLFRGIQSKTLHAASSSFCYFYIYSWVLLWWKQRRTTSDRISTLSRLVLSAMAAMLNTGLTLPLDVLSAQEQTTNTDEQEKMERMETAWEQAEGPCFSDALESIEDEKKDEACPPMLSEPPVVPTEPAASPENSDWKSYWKGLWPSLLLSSNPSIHYTVFDVLKSRVIQQRPHTNSSLSMGEAFFLGLVAKFVATMSTYPLIRAKVMLMVTSQTSMISCLIQEYRQDGLKGLYRGCHLQLVHTMLKSALLMMVRERITVTTHRLIIPAQQQQQAPSR